MSSPILAVDGLTIDFHTYDGVSRVVDNVSFEVGHGEVVGLVGESGCGKTVTLRAILGTLPIPPAKIVSGRILFRGVDLRSLDDAQLQAVRKKEVALIPQDPMLSLNPVISIETQMTNLLRWREFKDVTAAAYLKLRLDKQGRLAAREKALEMLRKVNIPDPERILKNYPFELSGGMRQRVLIAMALLLQPSVIFADEPGTALDVSIQDQILDLVASRVREENVAVLFITHDLAVARRLCDRICVMYAGHIVEAADAKELFANPTHPYTNGLMLCVPKLYGEIGTGIPGSVPNYYDPPSGCRFHPRCNYTMYVCDKVRPPLSRTESGSEHEVACHLYSVGRDYAPVA